jgi:magnesium chelatase family protein
VDRLDVHVSVPPVEVAALTSTAPGESSASVRERVVKARKLQEARRARREVECLTNACLSARELDSIAAPDRDGKRLLEAAISQLGLSARAYVKVLRVARTIADLDGCDHVRSPHIAEAVQGRLLDRESMS